MAVSRTRQPAACRRDVPADRRRGWLPGGGRVRLHVV